MKKKMCILGASVMYILSSIFIAIYFTLTFNKNISFSPGIKVIILILTSLFMYIAGILVSKNISDNYKNIPQRINIWVWFLLYIMLLFTLTLFDDYFYRNISNIFKWNGETFRYYISKYLNLIPFSSILHFVGGFIRGKISLNIFMYNIFGNILALMPFAFFLPILFKKQRNFKIFTITMFGIVILIELLQFLFLSGTCDIDDVILNVFGAILMFKILRNEYAEKIIVKLFGFV